MLALEQTKQIKDFVKQKPRTMNEISQLLDVNWRTADRYVGKIAESTGELAVRTFREGTRGALKVVYWQGLGELAFTDLQQELFEKIAAGRNKTDFSPFEIYQYVEKQKKQAFLEEQEEEAATSLYDFAETLRTAEKGVLFFSGNFSWINLKDERTSLYGVVKELAGRGIACKALCRVELGGLENIERVLALNKSFGKQVIEIRHCHQPLRAVVIDDKLARFKEMKNPADYKNQELKKKTFIFYEIRDKDWVEWLGKVFWRLFNNSVPAEKRIEELHKIRRLKGN